MNRSYENITYRRRKAASNVSVNSMDDQSFLSTESNILPRSLPDLSSTLWNCQELQEIINGLKIKLENAEKQIEDLKVEKNSLGKIIEEQELKINTLRKSITTKKNDTPKQYQNNKINEVTENNETNTITASVGIENEHERNNTKNVYESNKGKYEGKQKENMATNNTENNDARNKSTANNYEERKIHILGTQQIIGMATHLHDMRVDTSYEKYSVLGITKRNATATQLLSNNYDLKCLLTLNEIESRVLLQVENDVENTNVDPAKVAPSNKHTRRIHHKDSENSDSLESVVLAINTGIKKLLSAKSSPDVVDTIGRALANFAKNTAEPIYRSSRNYDIKPEIINFRSNKPSVMFEINSKSIISGLQDLLQSKVVRQYMDKFSKEAAVIYRALKKDLDKPSSQLQQ